MTTIKLPNYIKRPATTFRIREDFIVKVAQECDRLNCSRGVYFETLLLKAWGMGLINATDVLGYDPATQWAAQD
jgi:hypothetical protein